MQNIMRAPGSDNLVRLVRHADFGRILMVELSLGPRPRTPQATSRLGSHRLRGQLPSRRSRRSSSGSWPFDRRRGQAHLERFGSGRQLAARRSACDGPSRGASDGNSKQFAGKHRHGSRSGVRARERAYVGGHFILSLLGARAADRLRRPTTLPGNKHMAGSSLWDKNFKHDRLHGGRSSSLSADGQASPERRRSLPDGPPSFSSGTRLERFPCPILYICAFLETDRMLSPRPRSHFRSRCLAPRWTHMGSKYKDLGRDQELAPKAVIRSDTAVRHAHLQSNTG